MYQIYITVTHIFYVHKITSKDKMPEFRSNTGISSILLLLAEFSNVSNVPKIKGQ